MKNKPILQMHNWTVITDIKDIQKNFAKHNNESEDDLEKEFIKNLESIGYQYLSINNEDDLIINLKSKIEKLNKIKFNNDEWRRFYNENINNDKNSVSDRSVIVQENYGFSFKFDDGQVANIWLINKNDIFKNSLQVINQFEARNETNNSRYDVTILVNGLPLVHIELKKRGVNLKNAFNQIERYQNTSFNNLFNFVQIFVISNGSITKYYSNTTRNNLIDSKKPQTNGGKKISNSYEFTSYWTDQKNDPIFDLQDFTMTFFMKGTILNILTKYCVFDVDQNLKVMRPYQIIATEKIIERINIVINSKLQGKNQSGGYIWHTTGSGKTLTSFKVATLAQSIDEIKKVLFVVDRKDLDYQTIKEFNKFQKDAVNTTKSTNELRLQLLDGSANKKIVVTTIQKLSNLVNDRTNKLDVFNENIVLIFDECHRSQFGKMRKDIAKKFKKNIMFGFTGTPISAKNANIYNGSEFQTTEQIFGKELHQYTIVDAINDNNVLKFKIDYIETVKTKEIVNLEKGTSIDEERIYLDPRRIKTVAEYILQSFSYKTKRDKSYWGKVDIENNNDQVGYKTVASKLRGFNSLFAVSSIKAAMLYYEEFKNQQNDKLDSQKLKIGMIYSFNPNDGQSDDQGYLPDDNMDANKLDESSREVLESAIKDYNKMFKQSFDISNGFDQYYKDISLKMKNKELDILIVVNMFLTGFDAPQLNTLWVDKKLRYHGLLQAFSRTNRILNSVKSFGQIVTFRNIEKEVNDSIELFSNKNSRGIIILKSYQDYMEGFNDQKGKYQQGFVEVVEAIKEQFPLLNGRVPEIKSESSQRDFVNLFSKLQKLLNILSNFDEFHDTYNKNITEYEIKQYQSLYLDIWDKIKKESNDSNKISINDSIEFEIELIKQVEVNIDYILSLLAKYSNEEDKDNKIKDNIILNIDSSISLRDKKDLIMEFIEKQEYDSNNIRDKWIEFSKEKQEEEVLLIIKKFNLKEAETKKILDSYIKTGEVREHGSDINGIFLEKISSFGPNANKKIQAKTSFFERARNFVKKFTF